LAAIGIVHSQQFTPDQHRREILDKAGRIGAGLARTLQYKPRDRAAYFYDDGSWKTAFIGAQRESARVSFRGTLPADGHRPRGSGDHAT